MKLKFKKGDKVIVDNPITDIAKIPKGLVGTVIDNSVLTLTTVKFDNPISVFYYYYNGYRTICEWIFAERELKKYEND
jgi:hypothetical protein